MLEYLKKDILLDAGICENGKCDKRPKITYPCFCYNSKKNH